MLTHAAPLETAATRIKTFTEQTRNASESTWIKSAVGDAEQIIFLGFAFHPQNMELLSIQDGSEKQVYATHFGQPGPELAITSAKISNTFRQAAGHSLPTRKIRLTGPNETAANFVWQYGNVIVA